MCLYAENGAMLLLGTCSHNKIQLSCYTTPITTNNSYTQELSPNCFLLHKPGFMKNLKGLKATENLNLEKFGLYPHIN